MVTEPDHKKRERRRDIPDYPFPVDLLRLKKRELLNYFHACFLPSFRRGLQRLRRGGMPLEEVTIALTPLVSEPVAFDESLAYVTASKEKFHIQAIDPENALFLIL
jgi:hypothetical protein